jgi:hypothetical protein
VVVENGGGEQEEGVLEGGGRVGEVCGCGGTAPVVRRVKALPGIPTPLAAAPFELTPGGRALR